jgi:hypothetical protein
MGIYNTGRCEAVETTTGGLHDDMSREWLLGPSTTLMFGLVTVGTASTDRSVERHILNDVVGAIATSKQFMVVRFSGFDQHSDYSLN